jgi:hypothetical protein
MPRLADAQEIEGIGIDGGFLQVVIQMRRAADAACSCFATARIKIDSPHFSLTREDKERKDG